MRHAPNHRPPAWRAGIGRPLDGDYRIVYEIHDGVLVILVLAVGHRQEVYRNL
ncbi:type II toxin-antitoxin system RelE/ParE family toxin [Gryllotalpicola reticulitermitis]|uniref:Type II toxin-antitoxin system RelE/ParE family toxin n=1 Tax=Gryllotalpicola reticulitermitis TaxID=1184153 RepID=A0ABV8Q835_9MICO